PDARGEHQRAERRGEITHEELEVRRAEEREVRDDALDLEPCLIEQDHSDEPHRDGYEEQRPVADRIHLVEDRPSLPPPTHCLVEGLREDGVEFARADEQIDTGRAELAHDTPGRSASLVHPSRKLTK